MNMWELDTETLSTAVLRGGNEPYLKLIEPDLLSEIRDYFYYCQIRSHGERTTSKYVLDGTIPLSEIPYLMCALGCFPSQVEIQNMISEVKSKNFEVTGKSEDKINFDDFLQLYVNHRPVFQVVKIGAAVKMSRLVLFSDLSRVGSFSFSTQHRQHNE